jgi:hypothetical protein
MKLARCLSRPHRGRFDQPHDAAHSGGDALDSALGGGGSRGRGECRIAGGGEGEGGETMPDAEASPLHPDEPPRREQHRGLAAAQLSGRAGCPTSLLLSSRHDGSRSPRAGVVPPGPEAIAFPELLDGATRHRRLDQNCQSRPQGRSRSITTNMGDLQLNDFLNVPVDAPERVL